MSASAVTGRVLRDWGRRHDTTVKGEPLEGLKYRSGHFDDFLEEKFGKSLVLGGDFERTDLYRKLMKIVQKHGEQCQIYQISNKTVRHVSLLIRQGEVKTATLANSCITPSQPISLPGFIHSFTCISCTESLALAAPFTRHSGVVPAIVLVSQQ